MPDPRQDPLMMVPPQMKIDHIMRGVPISQLAVEDNSNHFFNQEDFADEKHIRLSHLEIVPPSDIEKSVQVPVTVIAAFTSYGYLSGMQTARSKIKRWKLGYVEMKLHSRFDEIASKGKDAEPQWHHLERISDVQLEQAIASFNVVDNGQTLVVTTLDGTTSFYNPTTMQQLFFENETNEVTSMSQAQFAFPQTPTPFDIALSTNACAAVGIAPDGTLQLSTMEHHAGIQTDSSNVNLDSALAAVAMTYIRACYNSINADDVVVCILRTIIPQHYHKLISLMSRSLFKDNEFLANGVPGSDIEKLLQKPFVAKMLSLHSVLGFTSATTDSSAASAAAHRDAGARYAWITLNIRQATLLLFFMFNAQRTNTPSFPQDLLSMMSNNARWSIEICRMIVDELFEIFDTTSESDSDKIHLQTPNTILVQCLLTGIWSRFFLRTLVKFLKLFLVTPIGAADPAGLVSRGIDEAQRAGLSLNAMSAILEACDRNDRCQRRGRGARFAGYGKSS